ncbi:hypothetical protein D9M68_439250 [compost metagenome]
MEAIKVIIAVALLIIFTPLTTEEEKAGAREILNWAAIAAAIGVIIIAFILKLIQSIFNKECRKKLMSAGFLNGWSLYVAGAIVIALLKFEGVSAEQLGMLTGAAFSATIIYGILSLIQVVIRKIVGLFKGKHAQ